MPFLDDRYKRKAVTWARQLGKTESLCIKASQQINMFPGSKVGIIAQNEKRAFKIYRVIKGFQNRHPLLRDLLQPKNDKLSEMILDLENEWGEPSYISYYASGSDGVSIRGDALDLLIMDEADYIASAAYPSTLPTVSATHGTVLLSSTPSMHKFKPFYNRFMDGWEARQKFEGKMPLAEGEKPYKYPIGRKYFYASYHYDYTHGLNVKNPKTGLPQTNINDVRSLKNDDYVLYEREYLAWWSEEGGQFFPQNILVRNLVPNDYSLPVDDAGGPFYIMGVDFARMKDYTAIIVGQCSGNMDKVVVVYEERVNKKDWTYIFRVIVNAINRFKPRYVTYDKKNVGDVIQVWLRFLSHAEVEFILKGESPDVGRKSIMYHNAKIGLSHDRVKIRKGLTILYGELEQMEAQEAKSSNALMIHAPEKKYDDCSDAFVFMLSPIKFARFENSDIEAVPYMDEVIGYVNERTPGGSDIGDYYVEVYDDKFFDGVDFEPDYHF
jgi:hypothetical protein